MPFRDICSGLPRLTPTLLPFKLMYVSCQPYCPFLLAWRKVTPNFRGRCCGRKCATCANAKSTATENAATICRLARGFPAALRLPGELETGVVVVGRPVFASVWELVDVPIGATATEYLTSTLSSFLQPNRVSSLFSPALHLILSLPWQNFSLRLFASPVADPCACSCPESGWPCWHR